MLNSGLGYGCMRFAQQIVRSCIIGGAAGDVLGGIVERRVKSFSDDTQLTVATCEAVLEKGEPDPHAIAERLRAWFAAGEITGVGSSTLKALRDLQAGAHWALAGARGEHAAGNGAAMRAAPLAFVLDPQKPADRTRLRDIARITHHHDEAYIGALAVILALRRAAAAIDWSNAAIATELPDSRVRDNLLRSASLDDRNLGSVVALIGASGFVAETIPVAFELARQMHATTFEGAIREMNSLGGDTDTIGSIAGQLWGVVTGADVSHYFSDISGAERVLRIADQYAHYVGT